MTSADHRTPRSRSFATKVAGIVLLALGITWAAAVYLFDLGVSNSLGLVLQPSISDALTTAKERTHDHIVALREQLKWRTERIASELRQRGAEARLTSNLEGLLRRWMEEDAAAFEAPDGRPLESGAPGAEPPPHGVLIDLSAIDATGRRIHVRRAGRFPESLWRMKTFRPGVPEPDAAGKALRAALRASLLCSAGGCASGPDRFVAAGRAVELLLAWGDPEAEEVRALDAAGIEAVYATPWHLFEGLEDLAKVLPRYKMLQAGGQEIRRRYTLVYSIFTGFALVAAIGVAILFARRVVRRLGAITEATRTVAQGDLTVSIAASGRDEIAGLATSFNAMVAQLRESRDRIAYLQQVSAWQGLARRLAHEIKNPLTPIQLAIQEVDQKYAGTDEAYRRILSTAREVIEEEVATLRRMTTEFSEFARLPKVDPQRSELGDFIDDCRSAFSSEGEVAGVRMEWRRPSDPVTISVDRQLMRRVIDNLVKNAVDSVRADRRPRKGGEGVVEVSARLLSGGRTAEIVVRDDGPGIAPEVSDHLFEPHFTTKPTGTGLGLAIAKKIVLEHGGDIAVESSDRGAVFRVRLPAASGKRRGGSTR